MSARPDVWTHIAHETDRDTGMASYTINGFRAITALQSFRGYEWMTDTRAVNIAGNFSGMVVSARWASAYEVISPVAKFAGNVATVASLASNIMNLAPQFERVYRSNDSRLSKAQQYSLLTSIVAQKT